MNLPPSDPIGLAWGQLWQVTVLVVVVGALVQVACRRRPHLAYLLWMLVVVKCLTPPLWSSPTGVFSWAQLEIVDAAADRPVELQGAPSPAADAPPAIVNSPRGPIFPSDDPAAAPAGVPLAKSTKASPAWPSRLSPRAVVATIWLLGVIGLGGVVLLKWLSFRRLLGRSAVDADSATQALTSDLARRLGLRRKVRVLVASEPLGPAVFGLARPTIVVSRAVLAGKTPDQIAPILSHELVHVRRGDMLWGALQVLSEVFWWFHPLVWWANREAGRERERCCDEAVVAGLKCKPAVYARCLLDVLTSERIARPVPALLGADSVQVTSRRLEDIMTRAGRFHPRTPRWCWAVLIAAAVLVLPGRQLVLGRRSAEAASGTSAAAQEPASSQGPETMISGEVLDPSGKPVAEAQVAVVGRSRRPHRGGEFEREDPEPLAETNTDDQGRFRLDVPPISSATFFYADVVAAKGGYGVGWEPLALDAEQHEVVVRLPEEQALRGRLVDAEGRPAAGARVYVRWVERLRVETGMHEGVGPRQPREQFPAWPEPVTTDEEGRFAIRGVNRQQTVGLRVSDDRFATWDFYVKPLGEKPAVRDAKYEEKTRYLAKASEDVYADQAPQELTLSPPPSQIIEGQVVYADTNEPAAHARLTAYARQLEFGSAVGVPGQADADGRFRLKPYPGKFFDVTAYPPNGQPYLILKKTITWPEKAASQEVEMALPRGVLVRGKISEKPSGEAVEGAAVQYYAASKNPHLPNDVVTRWQGMVISDAQGNFQIAVPAGKGTLLVHGPTLDYVQQVIGSNEIYYGRPGGRRNYVHASIPLDLEPGREAPQVTASLQRGVTVKGRLVGAEGQPVDEAIMLTHLYVSPSTPFYRGHSVQIRQGQFELPGCHPEKSTPVYILDPKNELGAVIEVSGQMGGGQPLEVRLAPCGSATARLVDTEGKPLVDYNPSIKIVMTPGHSEFPYPREAIERGEWLAGEDFVANFDRLHYWDGPFTDQQGRCTLPALIPGATYRLSVFDKASAKWVVKDFSVASGETLPLPEIVVKQND